MAFYLANIIFDENHLATSFLPVNKKDCLQLDFLPKVTNGLSTESVGKTLPHLLLNIACTKNYGTPLN